MVGDGSCARAWPAFSSASMVCAGGGSSDTCLGDSGAPLMVSRSGGFELVGVAAFGAYPCAERDVPGVYTRVGAPTLNAWIRSYIEPSLFALPQPPTPQAPLPQIDLPQESQSEPSIPDAPIGTVAVPLRHGTVAVPERVKLSTLRGKSLRVRFECERACTISGRLTLDTRSARRFGLGNGRKAVTIGRGSSSLAEAGSRMLTVTLTAKAKRALRNRSRVTPRLRTDLRSGSERLASTQKIAASR
jgi:hypothetical protein